MSIKEAISDLVREALADTKDPANRRAEAITAMVENLAATLVVVSGPNTGKLVDLLTGTEKALRGITCEMHAVALRRCDELTKQAQEPASATHH